VSNVDANTFETLLHNVAEWALTLYFECGRTDVDDDSEMLAVTLTDLIEDAKKLGRRGEALRTEVINAIVETYPMRVQTPSEWLQTSQQ